MFCEKQQQMFDVCQEMETFHSEANAKKFLKKLTLLSLLKKN